MNIDKIVVTMKVFEEQIKNGIRQHEFFKDINDLGLKKVEIRRELINDIDRELEDIKNENDRYDLQIYYSVPDYIFNNGKINIQILEKYFAEGRRIGAKVIKFSTGEFDSDNMEYVGQLSYLMDKYKMKVTIENDQTQISGTSSRILRFLEDCESKEFDIKCTFDVGNWYFTGEEPTLAALMLAKYTGYIHLKDIKLENEGLITVEPDHGIIEWRKLLNILPKNISVGLEFPGGENPQVVLKNTVNKLLALI